MSSAAAIWRTNRSRLLNLIVLASAGVGVASILLNLGFFFNPGVDDVLSGLGHHVFVLGCMLLLTSGSRTVSLGTLGIFWLLGVWGVYVVSYVFESQLASLFGAGTDSDFLAVWLAPFVEEMLKLAPVAIFLLLAGRSGCRHPAMSDGMLLGFMVGAGVSFQEDAHFGEMLVSGDGWGAATPWTAIFPTISPVDEYFALNHALWAAISGLSIGVALMLRHWRWTWPIALVGPVLAVTNHLMVNHYSQTEFGVEALLDRVSGRGVPWFFDTVRDLTVGGRLPIVALIAAAVAVAVVELIILRWVGKRDLMFPPLSLAQSRRLLMNGISRAGAAQLLAANRYLRLRRSVYFAGWRTKLAGGDPVVTDADYAQLVSLAVRLEALPPAATRPVATTPADTTAPVSDASAGDARAD